MNKKIKNIILLLITLVFLYFVFADLDIKQLFNDMKQFKIIYILPLIISIIISLSFRGLVFKQLLKKTVNPPLIELAHLCITTSALNIVLPARVGDIFRAFYIGQKYKTDKVKIFGTVMFERIFDVMVIFTFLLIGICIYHRNPIAVKLCLCAGICVIIGIILTLFAYKFSNKAEDICSSFIKRSCNSFFKGFEIIESPKDMLSAILTSFGIWIFECLNFYIVIAGFGLNIHWSVTLFIIGFIALACMIPSTSVYVGPYQIAIIYAFSMYNTEREQALAISIVEQSVVIITTSIIALIFLIKNNISYSELKQDIKK